MATFDELQAAFADGEMINLVKAAILKKAAAIVAEASPSATRLDFARDALENPNAHAGRLWRFIVGKQADQTLDAILRSVGDAATPDDPAIETQVNQAIDKFWP